MVQRQQLGKRIAIFSCVSIDRCLIVVQIRNLSLVSLVAGPCKPGSSGETVVELGNLTGPAP